MADPVKGPAYVLLAASPERQALAERSMAATEADLELLLAAVAEGAESAGVTDVTAMFVQTGMWLEKGPLRDPKFRGKEARLLAAAFIRIFELTLDLNDAQLAADAAAGESEALRD